MYKTNEEIWNETRDGEWLDCRFQDEETGETFFVELKKESGEEMEDFITKCQEVADEYFSDAEFDGLVDGDTAEILGYDTY
jgi:hypothetical protein